MALDEINVTPVRIDVKPLDTSNGAQAVANSMKVTGASASEVATLLKNDLTEDATTVAQTLQTAGYPINEVIIGIKAAFNTEANETVTMLQTAGYANPDILSK